MARAGTARSEARVRGAGQAGEDGRGEVGGAGQRREGGHGDDGGAGHAGDDGHGEVRGAGQRRGSEARAGMARAGTATTEARGRAWPRWRRPSAPRRRPGNLPAPIGNTPGSRRRPGNLPAPIRQDARHTGAMPCSGPSISKPGPEPTRHWRFRAGAASRAIRSWQHGLLLRAGTPAAMHYARSAGNLQEFGGGGSGSGGQKAGSGGCGAGWRGTLPAVTEPAAPGAPRRKAAVDGPVVFLRRTEGRAPAYRRPAPAHRGPAPAIARRTRLALLTPGPLGVDDALRRAPPRSGRRDGGVNFAPQQPQ